MPLCRELQACEGEVAPPIPGGRFPPGRQSRGASVSRFHRRVGPTELMICYGKMSDVAGRSCGHVAADAFRGSGGMSGFGKSRMTRSADLRDLSRAIAGVTMRVMTGATPQLANGGA